MMPEDVVVRDGADAALTRPPDVSMSVFMRQAVDFWREQDHSDRGLAFQHHYHMRNVEDAVRVGKPPPARPEAHSRNTASVAVRDAPAPEANPPPPRPEGNARRRS